MRGFKPSPPPEGFGGAKSIPEPVPPGYIPSIGAEPAPRRAPATDRAATLREIDQIACRLDACADRIERDGSSAVMPKMLREDARRLRGEITNAVRGMR